MSPSVTDRTFPKSPVLNLLRSSELVPLTSPVRDYLGVVVAKITAGLCSKCVKVKCSGAKKLLRAAFA